MPKGIKLKEAPAQESENCSGVSVLAAETPDVHVDVPEVDQGMLETEREIRRIERETRMSVENDKKKGVPPEASIVSAEQLWKDVELRLMRVRNLTAPVMQALKQRHVIDIKAKAREVQQWANYLVDSADKL
ncbi:MAG: hypothetical protein HQK96_14035 [Nitrospirae bacterium]|nr:hypothetical protein [Nitrospirota bacterium]